MASATRTVLIHPFELCFLSLFLGLEQSIEPARIAFPIGTRILDFGPALDCYRRPSPRNSEKLASSKILWFVAPSRFHVRKRSLFDLGVSRLRGESEN